MKLSDCLNKSTRNKLRNLSSKSKPEKKEHLTDKDLADLMGINRDRYERKGGAVRRK